MALPLMQAPSPQQKPVPKPLKSTANTKCAL